MSEKLRLAVLVSGRGSNLQAIIDACEDVNFPAEIAVVLSNKKDAYALERASKASIATEYINHRDYNTREDFDKAVNAKINEYNVDIVCLAGFMRIITEWFVDQWTNKMINIHPSLLPDFKGLNAQKQALDAGAKKAGCTVHFVTAEMDSGPIIIQAEVPIIDGDTEDSLSERILEQEHRIYPEAIRLIAKGQI